MSVQYSTTVDWDVTLIDCEYTDASTAPAALQGMVKFAVKTTTGAPTATAGKFIPGAIISNAISGINYQNTGTTASPVWATIDTGLALTLPVAVTDSTTTTTTSISFVQNLVTTGKGLLQSLTALTTGIGHQITAAAATLTTGRYFSANDGALEVFGVGANGHLHTSQTTAPTIAVTTANGISAAAITAGGTDVCGIITTTGTNDNVGATVLTVTFNKTYTTAPKTVSVTPRNASAAKAAATSLALPYVSSITATTFVLTIPADASAGATPSFQYQVIA